MVVTSEALLLEHIRHMSDVLSPYFVDLGVLEITVSQ